MKCSHCGEDIGEPSENCGEYDLMKYHIWHCTGEIARAWRKARDEDGDQLYTE